MWQHRNSFAGRSLPGNAGAPRDQLSVYWCLRLLAGENRNDILRREGGHLVAGLYGGTANVRGEHDVLELQELWMNHGLLLVHVEAGGEDTAPGEGLRQGRIFDAGVDVYEEV